MKVLGIDPGYDRLGVAVVEGDPSRPVLVMSDCITPPKGERQDRLAHIAKVLEEILATHTPGLVALETLFFNKNQKTAIGVAEARGVILAAAGRASLPVLECSPQQVKIAVTGHGGAPKSAVASMIAKLIDLPPKKRLDDELDAIAVAVTALATWR